MGVHVRAALLGGESEEGCSTRDCTCAPVAAPLGRVSEEACSTRDCMCVPLGRESEEAGSKRECTCAPVRTALLDREGKAAGSAQFCMFARVRTALLGGEREEGCSTGTARTSRCARRCSVGRGGGGLRWGGHMHAGARRRLEGRAW